MNAEEVSRTLEIIDSVRNNSCAVLLIEHNMGAVSKICDRCVVLSYGELIAEGTMDAIKKNPKVISAYLGEDEADA
jgi:ABC-type branched-subunit amino acid transport system ATPase component